MPRNAQAIRVLRLVKFLLERRFGATLDEIRREFSTSRRTVYRDLECIRDAGLTLKTIQTEGGVRWTVSIREDKE